MTLLIDNDAFCKLGICDLLEKVASALGSSLEDSFRLSALPYMLKKGRLLRKFGPDNCKRLLELADTIPELPPPGDAWLDKMSPISGIDPGEAELFAASIEQDALVLTGDKRAIKAVCRVSDVCVALQRRMVTVEAALLAVGQAEDLVALKNAIQPAMKLDTMLRTCFSEGNPDPGSALRSYQGSFASEIDETVLWRPLGKDDG